MYSQAKYLTNKDKGDSNIF